MPAHTLQRNLKTQPVEAAVLLERFFAHLTAMGLELTDLVITKTGASAGAVTITITQTLTADQRVHLGLN